MTERQPSTACRLQQRAAGEAEHRCAFCGSQRDAHRWLWPARRATRNLCWCQQFEQAERIICSTDRT